MIAEIDVGVFGDQLSGGLHVFVRDGVALLIRPPSCSTRRATRGAAGIAFHHELMPLGADADVEEGFELAQVVVVGPEKRGHARFGHRHLAHRRGTYSRISLRYKQLTANSHINTSPPIRSRSPLWPIHALLAAAGLHRSARRRVNSAAERLWTLRFCPDHSGVNSRLPAASAFARSGETAAAASGNAGASGFIGPTSRMRRLTMARAGRPVKTLVTAVSASPFFSAEPMQCARRRFGTRQVGSTHLHARGAERQSRGDTFRVGDAAGRNHRHTHRLHHLPDQCHGAELRQQVVGQKHAPMPARLEPLRNHRIGAVRLEVSRFFDGRCRRETFDPQLFTRVSSSCDGNPKWKLTTGGLNGSTRRRPPRRIGRAPRHPEWWQGRHRVPGNTASASCASAPRGPHRTRLLVEKKLTL